jgi:hypothetical protein
MDKFQLISQFNENTTKIGSQLNYIWANVLGNECKFGVTKACWLDLQKPIYIAFKLLNTFPIYNKKINVFIYLKCIVCENMHVDVTFST